MLLAVRTALIEEAVDLVARDVNCTTTSIGEKQIRKKLVFRII